MTPPAKATAAPAAAKKVQAPVEKSAPKPVAAEPIAASAEPALAAPAVAKSAAKVKAPVERSAPEPIAATATPPHGDAVTEPDEKPKVRKIEHEAAEPVDLLDAAGVPVAKRAIPVVAGVLVILWFLRRRRNRRR